MQPQARSTNNRISFPTVEHWSKADEPPQPPARGRPRLVVNIGAALGGQVPGPADAPDVPVTHRDRFYTSDQFSNTVSVVDPAENKLLGVIKLGDPLPANLSPLYRGQLLVH